MVTAPIVEWQRHSTHVRIILEPEQPLTQHQCNQFREFADTRRALPGYMASPTSWIAWFHRRDVSEAVSEIRRIQAGGAR